METFKTFQKLKKSSRYCLEQSNKGWKAFSKKLQTNLTFYKQFPKFCLSFPENSFNFVTQKLQKTEKLQSSVVHTIRF